MHIEGTIPDFHEFLNSKPEWVKLTGERDAARKMWQDRPSQNYKMLHAAYYLQAAEIVEERTVTHYEACMDEDESKAIQNWTGVHPELSVEMYNEVAEHLRGHAASIYEEVREHKAETKRLEHELDKVQSKVSKLYDKLREEYNEIKRAEK